MKFIISTFVILFSLICLSPTQAQNDFGEYQLPHPLLLNPLFVGSINDSAIFYGDEPQGSDNKPVVVYVHGFIDLANLWFAPGNHIYEKSYYAGYRTAWVAMTRGEGMWSNGEILAEMLEEITDHYGVDDVVIVAHSNGGKASEVAMFHHDKYDLVDRVITLGTPFKGTGLADIAETPAFNWLVDFIGLGGGTATSTTYYMEGVARPILDNDSDNQPSKFINFGAWGYDHGTTIAAPTMVVGGNILNYMGGGKETGGNDGVTPYYSSTRPGGYQVWDGWCWNWWCNKESKFDHIDITYAYVMWDDIRPWLEAPMGNRMAAPKPEIARGEMIESNFEMFSAYDGNDDVFTVNENSGAVSVNILHGEEENIFTLAGKSNRLQALEMTKSQGMKKGFSSSTVLTDLTPGKYRLETDADRYAAFVAYENGPVLKYDNTNPTFESGENVVLNAVLEGVDKEAALSAVVSLKNNLDGTPVSQGRLAIVDFRYLGEGNYTVTLPSDLETGIYNVILNAEGKGFRRSLVTGFAVMTNARLTPQTGMEMDLEMNTFPNPVVDQVNISFKTDMEAEFTIRVFDAYGRVVDGGNLGTFAEGANTANWDLSELASGVYFIELATGNTTSVNQIIKK